MDTSSSMSAPPAEPGAVVVGPQFCTSHPVDLAFTTKAPGVKRGRLAVVGANGNVIFRVESPKWNFNNRRLLVDAATGFPLVSLQPKSWSLHGRWQVFRGDSLDPKDLLFSVKSSSMFQFRTELDVFFAANTIEDVCDFKIKGSYGKRSCTIYKGDSSVVLAQMSKSKELKAALGKDAFAVNINRNTDSCFIIALVVILNELHEQQQQAVHQQQQVVHQQQQQILTDGASASSSGFSAC